MADISSSALECRPEPGLTQALAMCLYILRGKIDTVKSDLFAADGRSRSTAGKPECLSGWISARLDRTWENRL